MNIVILGDLFTFPEGDAAANRIYTYAKGILEEKGRITVVCMRNVYGEEGGVTTEGISYFYPFNQKARSEHFVKRSFWKVKKYLSTIKVLRKINRDAKLDAILLYSETFVLTIFAFALTRIFSCLLLVEQSEHPLRIYLGNRFKYAIGIIKLAILSKLYDGVLCISNVLQSYYRGHIRKNARIALVAPTVDFSRFATKSKESPFPFAYIGYFGKLTFETDAVDVLIKAFGLIAHEFPELNLVLSGKPGTLGEGAEMKRLVEDLGIAKRVVFLGYLKREEIPNYISNAKVLVMVRKGNLLSEYSFPSKLLEYLATGVPTIAVNVGEIKRYFDDGENIQIVEPDDENVLATKLTDVLSHYPAAVEVGLRGKKTLEAKFNYRVQAKEIFGIVRGLKGS